jgi:hypothetical protein
LFIATVIVNFFFCLIKLVYFVDNCYCEGIVFFFEKGRKRLAFTLEQKIQIISEIEGGKTKSDVSRELGLASSTVATIWKNRDNILSAYSSENLGRSHSPNNNDLFIPDIAMVCQYSNFQTETKNYRML